jgi:hypothetical protein
MQSVVVLSVNITIPAILEGPKDSIRETKHDFKAVRTFKDWMPIRMVGGTCKNLTSGVTRAFDQIKGAISSTPGAPLAKSVMMELHGEFLMHFRAIFTMEVTNYHQEIIGKIGGAPPHTPRSNPRAGRHGNKAHLGYVPRDPQGPNVPGGVWQYQ